MDGLHVKGMTKHKRDTVFSTEVCKPVPGKHAFGREDDLIVVGGDGLEQRLWGGWHVTVEQCFTSLVEDTDIHGAGVKIDTAVKRVLFGVVLILRSPPCLLYGFWSLSAYHGGLLGRGPQ